MLKENIADYRYNRVFVANLVVLEGVKNCWIPWELQNQFVVLIMKILASAIGRTFLCCALMSYMYYLSHASPLQETKAIMVRILIIEASRLL